MSAVLQEFEELGYTGASFGSIADRAGISKSLLSYYFPAKTDLADAVFARAFTDGVFMAAGTSGSLSPLDDLVRSVESVARALVDDQVARVAIRLQSEGELIGMSLPTPFVGWIQRVKEYLGRAVELGQLPACVDVDGEAVLLVATFVGLRDITGLLGDRSQLVSLAVAGTTGQLRGMGAEV